MAIEFRCPQCNRLLRTGDETAGRHAQCPECGAITPVPASTAASESPAPQYVPAAGNPFAVDAAEAQPPSDNPYQSPMSTACFVQRLPEQLALQRVAGPATALIVMSVLGMICDLLSLAFILVFTFGNLPGGPKVGFDDFGGMFNMSVAIIGLPAGIVMLIGAIKMKKLESYGLAMTAAVIGVIPYLSPCCPFGIPFGIWALVVLSDGAVKAAFRNRTS
jgi:phage FluMu protein Com